MIAILPNCLPFEELRLFGSYQNRVFVACTRTYNPKDGRGRKNPASKDKAMAELIDVVSLSFTYSFCTKRIVCYFSIVMA
jgi:hypothetical protein